MLGRITEEDGFIPRGTKKKKATVSPESLKNICMRESGASTYLQHLSQDITNVLAFFFPDTYREILTLAITRVVHQSPHVNAKLKCRKLAQN